MWYIHQFQAATQDSVDIDLRIFQEIVKIGNIHLIEIQPQGIFREAGDLSVDLQFLFTRFKSNIMKQYRRTVNDHFVLLSDGPVTVINISVEPRKFDLDNRAVPEVDKSAQVTLYFSMFQKMS